MPASETNQPVDLRNGELPKSAFTWIPIHREAIHRILEHRQNQKELLTILREMEQQGLKVISLQDKGADGQTIPLAEIDPFTFLASFNRGVTDKRHRIRIRTINLNQPWQAIHEDLLTLVV